MLPHGGWEGVGEEEVEAEKTESFLVNFVEPHFGQAVPFQSVVRTSASTSDLHCLQ